MLQTIAFYVNIKGFCVLPDMAVKYNKNIDCFDWFDIWIYVVANVGIYIYLIWKMKFKVQILHK